MNEKDIRKDERIKTIREIKNLIDKNIDSKILFFSTLWNLLCSVERKGHKHYCEICEKEYDP